MPNPPHRPFLPASPARLLPLLPALLLTWYVYRDVGGFGFVNYDDPLYVADNPRVTGGLSPGAVAWAFTTGEDGVWVPATRISFQLDASLTGPGPAGFHRTNLALHLLNVALVYLLALTVARSAVGAALAAAVFGVHPVNVEAVAWVTARKDLLMTACLAGAALALLRARRARGFVLAGLLGATAMLAKPAAVVAGPLLLLTARFGGPRDDGSPRPWRPDLVLAATLVAFAAAVSLIALRLAPATDLAARFDKPLPVRLGEAATGVFRYLGRLAWPVDLTVRYPESETATGAALAVGAAAGLLALTWLCARGRRRFPAAAPAWGWFLLCLLPALGIVRGGQLPLADRYAYLAAIGLWLALAAAIGGALARRRAAGLVLTAVTALLVVAAALTASRQAATWRDDEAFWRHALDVSAASELPHLKLGELYAMRGQPAAARRAFESALALVPRAGTHVNAGNACLELGDRVAAESHFRRALALAPALPEASLNLGALLAQRGELTEAREVLLAAEGAQPGLASLQYNLALVAFLGGEVAEARERCRRALVLDATHAGARELQARLIAAPPVGR